MNKVFKFIGICLIVFSLIQILLAAFDDYHANADVIAMNTFLGAIGYVTHVLGAQRESDKEWKAVIKEIERRNRERIYEQIRVSEDMY